MKQLIKYPGSKFRSGKWIASKFPKHHSYLYLFCGSLGVLCSKEPSNIETINDLDNDITNFFEVVKNRPDDLAHVINVIPYARTIFDHAFDSSPETPVDKAVNFLIKNNMGHGFRTTGEKTGWKIDIHGRERAYALKSWNNLPENIVELAHRLKKVQIENRDCFNLLERFNYSDVLIYADPPYMLSTRLRKQYKHEFDDKQHIELLKRLKEHKGSVVLSGYDNELYQAELKDWNTDTKAERTQVGTSRTEKIWMNY